ncbi:helix-turn-helix domain-containing protein [Parasediminibacterium sp. JCM 36343]|uniref:helix-turn-helix domain-containing protein n=1 Tax=Parasediminibacterium sp. JCM 36343 TaxID=3374279 RepID=UPI00397BE057
MMLFFEKLLIARRLLSLSQREASEQSGINQATLSILERGERKFIPTEYLQFLYKKGIDINWIFDEFSRTDNIFHNNFLPVSIQENEKGQPQYSEASLKSLLPRAGIKKHSAHEKENPQNDIELSGFFTEILQELRKLNDSLHPAIAH